MRLQRKLIIVALASAMPWVSAQAQSAADLQKEIAALKAQLQSLQQKVDAISAAPPSTNISQQVTRLEQKMELVADEQEKSGFKGVKINGVIEASYKTNDLDRNNAFSSSGGFADEFAMLQITKESQDGEGVDWTLRLLPGSSTYNHVHEASVSIPINKENRIIGGMIPDFQGYEFYFANANATLGNQLLTHNALFDLTGATSYKGLGMAHTFNNGAYALKWIVGNVDAGVDNVNSNPTTFTPTAVAASNTNSVALAYRADWFINEFSYVGLSGLHGSVNRNFTVMSIDGGYTHGDWAFNGQLSWGSQRNAATTGEDARWAGVSGLMGYKVTPRLQLLARVDFIDNRTNGGGTYAYNGSSGSDYASGYNFGLGQELDSTGAPALDAEGKPVGANLTRVSLGTNYQVNANTQWKVEYRLDQSTGNNFRDIDGNFKQNKNTLGTSVVLSF